MFRLFEGASMGSKTKVIVSILKGTCDVIELYLQMDKKAKDRAI